MAIIPTPVPTPTTPQSIMGAQSVANPDWTAWNDAWNKGYNRTGYSYSDPFLQGAYSTGQAEYYSRNPSQPNIPSGGGTTTPPVLAPVQAPSGGGSDIISRIGRGDFVGQERADASGMYRWNGNGWDWTGSHQERLGAQIESAYAPTMEYLTGAETGFKASSAEEQKRLEEQYQTYLGRIPTEKAGFESQLAESQRKTFETQQSAYDQATRAYNALSQQAGAKYGMASSAGGAVGELARREYARQQGQIGQQGVSAQTEFARQAETIRTYITQKTEDLKIQRDDAVAKLKTDLQDRLLQIAGLRTQTEQAKAQLKLQVVQDAINQAREIENYDKQLRAGLASFGLQQLATVSGRTLSPTEIQSYATQFGILPATTTGTSQPLSLLQTGVGGIPGKTTEDILAQGTAAY